MMTNDLLENSESAEADRDASPRTGARPRPKTEMVPAARSRRARPPRPETTLVAIRSWMYVGLLAAIWRLASSAVSQFSSGGFTLKLDGEKPVFDCDAWLVSLGGHEAIFAVAPRPDQVVFYVLAHLDALLKGGRCFGGWFDGAHWVLDVSVAIRTRQAAEQFGQFQRQKAIFNPATNTTAEIPQREDTASPRFSSSSPNGKAGHLESTSEPDNATQLHEGRIA